MYCGCVWAFVQFKIIPNFVQNTLDQGKFHGSGTPIRILLPYHSYKNPLKYGNCMCPAYGKGVSSAWGSLEKSLTRELSGYIPYKATTVHRRNPAPGEMENIPFLIGFHGFIHQQHGFQSPNYVPVAPNPLAPLASNIHQTNPSKLMGWFLALGPSCP